jgi:hypothetical protein
MDDWVAGNRAERAEPVSLRRVTAPLPSDHSA